MSADNTIAVLQTKRRDGVPGCEYRVAHVMAVESIWDGADYPTQNNPILNRAVLRSMFAGTGFVTDRQKAEEIAQNLLDNVGVENVEYGVQFYEFPYMFFPASRYRRSRGRRYRNN